MESLVADFIQFSNAIANFFLKGGRVLGSALNFEIFLKFPDFLSYFEVFLKFSYFLWSYVSNRHAKRAFSF